jgi:hypothetical protein
MNRTFLEESVRQVKSVMTIHSMIQDAQTRIGMQEDTSEENPYVRDQKLFIEIMNEELLRRLNEENQPV